jgi:signal transduction histidine kinase
VLPVIAGTARQALSELRRTLSALSDSAGQRPAADELAPQPGLADLAPLLERIQAAGPRISHRTAGDLDALPPGVQLTVYRIVQEALTNSLKHAGPATRPVSTPDATAMPASPPHWPQPGSRSTPTCAYAARTRCRSAPRW